MEQKRANELCAENLALKLSQALPCEQPDRASLDSAIARKMVEKNVMENPLIYSYLLNSFDAAACECMFGRRSFFFRSDLHIPKRYAFRV
jgi:hypothetical protein